MQIDKPKLNFENITGKLVTFRNGERLKVSEHKFFPETRYNLCHALMFESVGRYMLFTEYGTKSLNRQSDHDIIEVQEW